MEALCTEGEGGEGLFFVEMCGLAGFGVLVAPSVFVGGEGLLCAFPCGECVV
jgi:hypothetical protein